MAACEGSLLLALPDPCLLQVLQCCAAAGPRSLFSAVRAHSRLHQAAVVVLHSIIAQVSQQQQMDSVMVYLGKHSQHVNNLQLTGADEYFSRIQVRQLPPQLQLSSLQLEGLSLQLQSGNGLQGVLGAATTVAALKQLRLTHCQLLDNRQDEALAAALSQMPVGLERLSINDLFGGQRHRVQFPAGAMQQLQHLTYLELVDINVAAPVEADPALQPLQALTRLVDFKLDGLQAVMPSSMLSGMQHLTHLELSGKLEPDALAGTTQLQHLCLSFCRVRKGAAGVAQLLSHLKPLQQLTHLSLNGSLQAVARSSPSASAYAALTASSKLQHLFVSYCTLPTDVWQHVFQAGRRLPNLQVLAMAAVKQPNGELAKPPEGSRLVSCCPGLRLLKLGSVQCSAQSLALLQGLSGLRTLECNWGKVTPEVVQAVGQLTGLRKLTVWSPGCMKEEGLLLHLTKLQQLTVLHCLTDGEFAFDLQIDLSSGHEPVWRQLARLHLDHPDPGVAQQAAAALADSQ